jgi:hypothetical protein
MTLPMWRRNRRVAMAAASVAAVSVFREGPFGVLAAVEQTYDQDFVVANREYGRDAPFEAAACRPTPANKTG